MERRNLCKIAVAGCGGRMGQVLTRIIDESAQASLFALTERQDSPLIGTVAGSEGISVSGDPKIAFAGADAVIDFTSPVSSLTNAKMAGSLGFVHVIGTTGFSSEQLTDLGEYAKNATIIRAGNMSLGVTLLLEMVEKVAGVLDDEFDIEICDTHHGAKLDAPSGTALMLGEAAAKGRNISLVDNSVSGRAGITGPRKSGSIGFSAVRAGDIIGEHDVMFAGQSERIHLRHVATDRTIFARGALKAALWGQDRKPGEYSMRDVLGFTHE